MKQTKRTYKDENKFYRTNKTTIPTNSSRIFGKEISNIPEQNENNKTNLDYISLFNQSQSNLMNFEYQLNPQFFNNYDPEPLNVKQYYTEIKEYTLSIELENGVQDFQYMNNLQKDINEKMRSILIDWLVDVHLKFKLVEETFFLTINLIDRFLEKVPISRSKLQLVGVAAMFIACKYEEIYSPELKDFVYVCDNAYTKDEILEMESFILQKVNFDLGQISSYRVCNQFRAEIECNDKIYHMVLFLIEAALVEYKTLKFPQSLISVSSFYLANRILDQAVQVQTFVKISNYTEQLIKQCAKELFIIFQHQQKSSLTAIKRKFSSQTFSEVAKIIVE